MSPMTGAPGHEREQQGRRDARRWLLGLGLVTIASWGRWAATGSLKVDESYPSEGVGTVLFAVLVAGWALLVLGWRGMLAHPPVTPRRLAFAGVAVAALMLPMISNDVFSVLAYGDLAAHGRDVYTTAAALPESRWYGWVGEHWNEKVCVYGPTTLALVLPSALAGGNPWLAIALLRLAWLVPLALVMELSFRRVQRPFFHAMVWLNPLFLVEGPGQLHADVLGLAAIACGVAIGVSGRPRSSAALYAIAVLGKVSFAFTGTWFWLHGARTGRERLLRLPVIAAALLVVGVLSFAPFWRGTATITEPLRALSGMNPGGSITEVVGTIVNVLRGGGIPHADAPVRDAVSLDQTTNAGTWLVVSLVMRLVALVVGVRLLRAMFREPHDDDRVALGTGAVVVAAITLASHRFQAWYLMAALPFFGLCCTDAWRRWWIAVVAVSVTTEFVYVLPRTALVLPVWVAVTTGATVVLFVTSFRARFWTLDAARPEATAREAP
jgi:hypothetical protein